MLANVTVFYSLANIDSLPYNKSELRCRITRANIADMFAVTFVSGVIERTLHQRTWANIRWRIREANFADMFAVLQRRHFVRRVKICPVTFRICIGKVA